MGKHEGKGGVGCGDGGLWVCRPPNGPLKLELTGLHTDAISTYLPPCMAAESFSISLRSLNDPLKALASAYAQIKLVLRHVSTAYG